MNKSLSATARTGVAVLLLSTQALGQPGTAVPTVEMSDAEVIRSGRTTFARNCAVGYCHGKGGRANRGPRLRGRTLERDYLFRVIRDGIPRSSMPSWGESLNEDDIWAVVAYIEILSPLGPDDPDPYAPGNHPVPAPAAVSPIGRSEALSGNGPVAGESQPLLGDPEAGEQMFFDTGREHNCGGCHRVGGVGGSVGPDLSGLHERSARSIFIDTILPNSNIAGGGELYRMTTVGDEQLNVLMAGESRTRIKVYNVDASPPVLRSFRRDQVGSLQSLNRSGMPDTYGEQYTLKQLLDLVSFLKSSGAADPQPLPLTDIL